MTFVEKCGKIGLKSWLGCDFMRFTGICRPVDELGRVVIPKEIRTMLGIAIKDKVEIYMEGNAIVLRKHETKCALCGNDGEFIEFGDKIICEDCAKKIKALAE